MAKENKKGIQITLTDEVAGGVYANRMDVSFTPEEFFLDFAVMAPHKGKVMARIITSPGHLKRIITALENSVKRYEENIGEIASAEEPTGSIAGFN